MTEVTVAAVAEGSPAARAGIEPGSRLLAVGGQPVRDVLELYFRESAARLEVEILTPSGQRRRLSVRKGAEEPLGIALAPTKDLACREKCVFCFVHQNPRGLRKPLYFKDDDYRLSFLHGNFVTLTHAPEGAVERILEQHLSPLYVSVHATDPELRGRLLGNRGPAPIVPILERLAAGGITIYGQIVLCPGWNDGEVLVRTLLELAALHPACAAVAVVPLGLTAHRERLPHLQPFGAVQAIDTLRRLAPLQRRFRRELGTSFGFAADEIYLRADAPMPAARHYEGFPMLEDGVGMWRAFHDAWTARTKGERRRPVAKATLVTGRLFAPTLARLAAGLLASGVDLRVVAAENRLFGPEITVAGLLSGRCLVGAIGEAGLARGEAVLVPGSMLLEGGDREQTLDDMTLEEISARTGTVVTSGGRTADDLLASLAALGGGTLRTGRTA